VFNEAVISHCLACSYSVYNDFPLGEASLRSVEREAPDSNQWNQSGEKSASFS
jgi:hypothetical protein